MKALLLLLALPVHARAASLPSAPGEYDLPTTTAAPRLDFSAGDFDYRQGEDRLRLSGGASVRYSSWTLKAGEVNLDLKTRTAAARESVAVEDGRSVVFADSATLNLETHEGFLEGVSAGVSPWYIQARSARFDKDRRVFRRARVTSCNFVPPHYYISASKLTLYPGTSMWIDNAVFYIGRFPALYLPLFYRDLRSGGAVSPSFGLGYSELNGAEFKTTTLIRANPLYYGRLYLDGYTAQGLGLGAELDGFRPSGRGSLYAYRVQERSSGRERWTLLGDVYRHWAGPYSFQARLQGLSDPGFNAQYLRSESFQVTPDLTNSLALTRQTPATTTRVSFSRHDSQDPIGARFLKDQESLPRVDFIAAPFAVLGLSVLNSFAAFADNAYDPSSGASRGTFQGRYELVRGFSLRRGLTLTPRLHYQETFYDQISSATAVGPVVYDNALVGRYGSDVNLRWSNPLGDTDLSHRYETRSAVNSSAQDAAADDRGVEADLLAFSHAFRPDRRFLLRVSSGWDLRALRDRGLVSEDRLQPVLAEAQWTPPGGWSFFSGESFQSGRGSRGFFIQSDYVRPEGSFNLGLSQSDAQGSDGNKLFLQPGFSWTPPGGSWSLAGVLRLGAGSGFSVFDKSLTLDKDFHDFSTQWEFRARPGNNTFSFHVHLRVLEERRVRASEVEKEREFYPWRVGAEGR